MRIAWTLPLLLASGCNIYFGNDDTGDDDVPPPTDAMWWPVDAAWPDVDADPTFSCEQTLTCGAADPGRVNVCGWLVDVENGTRLEAEGADGVCDETSEGGACGLEVRFYDALQFAANPNTAPVGYDELYVDECGRFRATNVVRPSLGFIAIATDDAEGTPDTRRLAAWAAPVTSGQALYVFAPVMRTQTDARWTETAGLTGDTIVDRGAVLLTFTSGGTPVAGVTATASGGTPTVYYFSDTTTRRSTIAPAQTSTGANGSAVVLGTQLGEHSATGGGCATWSSGQAASIPGVLLVGERTCN